MSQLSHAEELFFVAICGAITGLLVGIGIHDWSMAAHAGEKMSCKDRPAQKAYMMRLPGESHSVETCRFVPRYGDPAWVPALGEPTIPGAGVRGKLGLEQQLGYVRDECNRLAKQLKQRC